eukprot:contig_28565_g7024
MCSDLTFCQCFFSSDTRKLTARTMLVTMSASSMFTWPTAVAMHSTFFSWNLTVERSSVTLSSIESACVNSDGKRPALLRPGPRIRGMVLIIESEARKASYFLANFFTGFFCLLNFFSASTSNASRPSF